MSKLCDAIHNLPHQFITMDLVKEAAKEHNPQLLSHLPKEFITPDVVSEIFSGDRSSYYWKCDLSLVPVECRTEEVCLRALRCSSDNMIHVPTHIINDKIVEIALSSTKRLHFLPLLPLHLWTAEFVYRAMKAIGADYDNSRYLRENSESDILRRCRVVMSIAQENVKTRSFFHGLFREKMASDVISAITPAKYRDKKYFRLMAHYNLNLVPVEQLTYELILIALGEDAGVSLCDIFKPEQRRDIVFGIMDNHMADAIVTKQPTFFDELPDKFQTSTRLRLAVKSAGEQGQTRYHRICYDEKLLTLNVVKEFIKQGLECKIPEKYWNKELAQFCFENPKAFFWFEQMPKGLQTKEMVTAAVRYSHRNLEYALKENITQDIACEVVRAAVDNRSYNSCRDNMKYLPEKYFKAFTKKTGLPENFMGGEVDFRTFKAVHKHFTYCRIGNVYAGIYTEGYRGSEEYTLILSRVDKGKTPKMLYEGHVGAFHKTWLEKPIFERDGKFIKPKVDPTLRDVQGVSYYGVELIEQRDGFDIYANTFCGITVGYCAKKDGLTYHDDTIDAALAGWQEKVKKAKQVEAERTDPESTEPDLDSVVFTAEILHRKYGFCETGMTAFVNDYGLDYNGRYSVGYMRQVVAFQGPKPSLRSYGRELRQINVIR